LQEAAATVQIPAAHGSKLIGQGLAARSRAPRCQAGHGTA